MLNIIEDKTVLQSVLDTAVENATHGYIAVMCNLCDSTKIGDVYRSRELGDKYTVVILKHASSKHLPVSKSYDDKIATILDLLEEK